MEEYTPFPSSLVQHSPKHQSGSARSGGARGSGRSPFGAVPRSLERSPLRALGGTAVSSGGDGSIGKEEAAPWAALRAAGLGSKKEVY